MFDLLARRVSGRPDARLHVHERRELSQRTYPQIGVTEQHHTVSHHGNDPDKIAKVAKINTYHATLFAKFLEKLRATPDGDGSLLDHSLIVYGGGMGNPEPARQRSAAAAGGRRRRREGQPAHQARPPDADRQPVGVGGEPRTAARSRRSARATDAWTCSHDDLAVNQRRSRSVLFLALPRRAARRRRTAAHRRREGRQPRRGADAAEVGRRQRARGRRHDGAALVGPGRTTSRPRVCCSTPARARTRPTGTASRRCPSPRSTGTPP